MLSTLLPVLELPGCARVPVTVARVEWLSTAARRRKPPAPLEEQWRLEMEFVADDDPFRVAAILRDDRFLRYSRDLDREPALERQVYRIDVRPYDWDQGDEVGIGILGTGAAVTSSLLRETPQKAVQPLVHVGDALLTGTVVGVAEFVGLGLVAQIALIAGCDTKKDRTRWRIRGPQPEGHPYSFLWTGRRSGVVRPRTTMGTSGSNSAGDRPLKGRSGRLLGYTEGLTGAPPRGDPAAPMSGSQSSRT